MKGSLGGGRRLRRRSVMLPILALALSGLVFASAAQEMDWEGLSGPMSFGEPAELLGARALQSQPSVACDTTLSGTVWAVWEDQRLGDADIFGARLTVAGEVIESTGVPLAVGPMSQTTPKIAAGDGRFLVIWQATDPDRSEFRIEGLRLTDEGEILDEEPLLVTRSARPMYDLDLAYGGGVFLASWSDTTMGDRIVYSCYGARLSPEGEVLDSEPLVLSAEPQQQSGCAVVFGAERFLLAFSHAVTVYDTTLGSQGQITAIDTLDIGEIAARFLLMDGTVTDSLILIEPSLSNATYSNDDRPMVAWSGERYLVAWPARTTENTGSLRRVFGRMLSPEGEILTARLTIQNEERQRDYRNLAANQAGFQFAWVSRLPGQRISYYGVHVDSLGAQISTTEYEIVPLVGNRGLEDPSGCAIAWNGQSYLFVGAVQYMAIPGDDSDIARVLLDTNGVVQGAPVTIGLAAPAQVPSGIAHASDRYLVLFEEQVRRGWMVRGAFVDEDGALMGAGSFLVLPDTLRSQLEPVLAYGGGGYVMAWNDGQSRLYAARLDAGGQRLGAALEVSNMASGRPAIAWDGERFGMAWRFVDVSNQGITLGRLELAGDGLALAQYEAAPGVFSTTALVSLGTSSDPAVICTGDQTAVLWSGLGTGVFASQVADTVWSFPSRITLSSGEEPGVPSGMFDGDAYFTAWSDARATYGTRMRTDFLVLDPGRIPLDPHSDSDGRPTVAFDGHHRVAVWRAAHGAKWILAGGRYGADGLPIAGKEVFADESASARWPLTAAGPSGQVMLVYSAYLGGEQGGAMRLSRKLWQQQPPEVMLALHQNPGVTSDVGVLVFPSEPVPAGGLEVFANGAPIEMVQSDATHNIYQGWYQARSTAVVRIVAAVGDSSGNLTEAERTFSIGPITPEEGGMLAGPLGQVELSCPPRTLATSCYLMILPDDAREAEPGVAGFLLSPPDLDLRAPVLLTVSAAARPAGPGDPSARPVLERRTATGWETIAGVWDAAAGTIQAPITRLGQFRTRWETGPEASTGRLMLTLGPSIWRGELTLRFRLPHSGAGTLAIFDLTGRRVATLFDGMLEAGREETVFWDGVDATNRPVGSGVYFARLRQGHEALTRRSILLR